MNRFVLETLLFALVQLALVSGLLYLFSDARAQNPLYASTNIKHRRLAAAPSPRLILVGGSNVLFGIDSAMIERESDYNPVNMGLIGGLRLEYMLNEAYANVREGDTVVLSIEYNSLNASPGEGNLEVMLGIATNRPANLLYLTWPQWKQVLDGEAVQYFGILFRRACDRIAARSEPRDRRERGGRPVLESVNEYGDLTLYHDPNARLPRNPNNQQTLGKIVPEQVDANIDRINDFVRLCALREAHVMFAAPPVPQSEFERRGNIAMRFDRALAQRLNAPVLLRPAEVVFPDGDFIGRSYHLRGDGVRKRTQDLIDALRRQAGLSPPAASSAPAASAPAESQPQSREEPAAQPPDN